MDFTIVDISTLDQRQLEALERLLTVAFPADSHDLIRVETRRACDPLLGQGLVALQDDRVTGAVLARLPRTGSRFVSYLAVAASHRRQGLASSLLDQLTRAAGKGLELLVTDGNVAAERLYRDGGLVPIDNPGPARQRRWAGTWKPRQVPSSPRAATEAAPSR